MNDTGFDTLLDSVFYTRKAFSECEFAHFFFKDLQRDVNFIRDDYAAIK